MYDYKDFSPEEMISPKLLPIFEEDLQREVNLESKLSASNLKAFRYGSKSPLHSLKEFFTIYNNEYLPKLKDFERYFHYPSESPGFHQQMRQEYEECLEKLNHDILKISATIERLWNKDRSIFILDQLEIRSLLTKLLTAAYIGSKPIHYLMFYVIWLSLVIERECELKTKTE